MADYKEKFDELHRAARQKARDLDQKFAIKDLVEEGARVAGAAAKRGAETVVSGAERLRVEAERMGDDAQMREATDRAAKEARKAGETLRGVAGSAGKKAGEVFEDAKTYYEHASKVYDTGARLTRASTAATAGVLKAKDWIKENPGKAAVVSVSLILGVRLGASFPGLDAVLLGSHPHWLTHSALPVWGLKKASDKFDGYLRKQEELIAAGQVKRGRARAS